MVYKNVRSRSTPDASALRLRTGQKGVCPPALDCLLGIRPPGFFTYSMPHSSETIQYAAAIHMNTHPLLNHPKREQEEGED